MILPFDSPGLRNFPIVPAEVRDPNRFLVLVDELFGMAYMHVECIPRKLDPRIVFVFPDQLVSSIFSIWVVDCFSARPS